MKLAVVSYYEQDGPGNKNDQDNNEENDQKDDKDNNDNDCNKDDNCNLNNQITESFCKSRRNCFFCSLS